MSQKKSHKPRRYKAPGAVTASLGEHDGYFTLDDMEEHRLSNTPLGEWSRSVLLVETNRIVDELVGSATELPAGVLDLNEEDHDVLIALVSSSGQVWDGEWRNPRDEERFSEGQLIALDEADVAFFVRAINEGADAVVLSPTAPTAWLDRAVAVTAASVVNDFPSGSTPVAVVDPLNKDAVLELLAVAPGPQIYRRHDGAWQEDSGWISALKSLNPPHLVKLDEFVAAGVEQQVDESTRELEFNPFQPEYVDRYTASGSPVNSPYLDDLQRETDDLVLQTKLNGLIAVAGRELSPKDVASTERLKRYWTVGKGAAKVRWGQPGAWTRCYKHLVKYVGPKVAPGLCTNLSKRLGGPGIATHVLSGKRG